MSNDTHEADNSTDGAIEFLDLLADDLRLLFENTNPEDYQVLNAIRLVIGHVSMERAGMLEGRCPGCGSKHDTTNGDDDERSGTLQ